MKYPCLYVTYWRDTGYPEYTEKDKEFEKVTMTIPENQGFYIDSHELIELARLAEETLNL